MSVDIVKLSCANCGAELEITDELDRFACSYCGSEQVVKRRGGTVSLSLVGEKLEEIRKGVDKTASELAIKRLREDIVSLESGKSSIMADKESSIKSMRLVAKILIIPGILVLLGGIEYFTEGSPISIILLIAGIFCTILAAMFFRSSIVYSNQCNAKIKDIDQSIRNKKTEINIHLEELDKGK